MKKKSTTKKYLVIVADTNDADYVETMNVVTDEQLQKLDLIIKAIKKCKDRHNWPNYDGADKSIEQLYEGILTEKQIEFFNDLCPTGEYGIHTIESIRLLEVISDKQLL